MVVLVWELAVELVLLRLLVARRTIAALLLLAVFLLPAQLLFALQSANQFARMLRDHLPRSRQTPRRRLRDRTTQRLGELTDHRPDEFEQVGGRHGALWKQSERRGVRRLHLLVRQRGHLGAQQVGAVCASLHLPIEALLQVLLAQRARLDQLTHLGV